MTALSQKSYAYFSPLINPKVAPLCVKKKAKVSLRVSINNLRVYLHFRAQKNWLFWGFFWQLVFHWIFFIYLYFLAAGVPLEFFSMYKKCSGWKKKSVEELKRSDTACTAGWQVSARDSIKRQLLFSTREGWCKVCVCSPQLIILLISKQFDAVYFSLPNTRFQLYCVQNTCLTALIAPVCTSAHLLIQGSQTQFT